MWLLAALASAFLNSAAPAPAVNDPLQDRDSAGSLRDFIITYLDDHRDTSFERDRTAPVSVARTALGPNDPDGYVIYVRGRWCGSGGCHMLIVSKVAGRFQPVDFIQTIELPISIERPDGAGANARLVTFTLHGADGILPVTLSRRADGYVGDPPYGKAQPHGKLEPLITKATPVVPLY